MWVERSIRKSAQIYWFLSAIDRAFMSLQKSSFLCCFSSFRISIPLLNRSNLFSMLGLISSPFRLLFFRIIWRSWSSRRAALWSWVCLRRVRLRLCRRSLFLLLGFRSLGWRGRSWLPRRRGYQHLEPVGSFLGSWRVLSCLASWPLWLSLCRFRLWWICLRWWSRRVSRRLYRSLPRCSHLFWDFCYV